jgi:hypothetical protein
MMANQSTPFREVRRQRSNSDRPKDTASSRGHASAPASGRQRRRSNTTKNPQRSYEKYVVLARAEALSGDAIASEFHYQCAEHFFRLMNKKSVRDAASEPTQAQAD